jgi:hypothetical protein
MQLPLVLSCGPNAVRMRTADARAAAMSKFIFDN